MNKNSKIFIAGHKGMVGSAIKDELSSKGYKNLYFSEKKQLDLSDKNKVDDYFKKKRPEFVFLAAARVGGIVSNNNYPVDFLLDNLVIQNNVINACYEAKVKRLIFLGSSCIYPKHSSQPIAENELLSGKLEETNEPYAIAKIAGIKLCESFNRQFNTDYRCLMPTNLYGPKDNFNLQNSHVIPALMHKIHKAKVNKQKYVEIWGTGKPKREFLHVRDIADAAVFFMKMPKNKYFKNLPSNLTHINIGTGEDIKISKLAEVISKIIGYDGALKFNEEYPDGTLRKLLDVNKARNLGWNSHIGLESGLSQTYEWFLENINNIRK